MAGAQRQLDDFNAAHARRRLPYYEVLGVPPDAGQAEIVRAYRKLSLKFHPDKPGGSSQRFQELNKAYQCLKDAQSRRKYDDCGFDEDNIDSTEVDQFVDAFFGEGARNVDGRSPDWSMNSIANYVYIDLEEVPLHMKDIVRIGLNYLVALDHDFENVVLLQHARVDILYLMVGLPTAGNLTQELFDSEETYPITYYDNPLQPGIAPRWSDQNVLGSRKAKKKPEDLPRRDLNFEEFQRRQKHALAMLENAPADPQFALEEKYRARMLEEQHKAGSLADATRSAGAIDVYEDDAELDCNAFAASCEAVSRSTPTSAADGGASGSSAEAGSAATEQPLASRGPEEVLGLNSDGVLFASKGGVLLRNEGPAAPAPPQSVR